MSEEEQIRKELEGVGIEVKDIVEDSKGLYASVGFDGSENDLRRIVPEPYYCDFAYEDSDETKGIVREKGPG